jgi:hypothetical protein
MARAHSIARIFPQLQLPHNSGSKPDSPCFPLIWEDENHPSADIIEKRDA